jgi:hypothetical protein
MRKRRDRRHLFAGSPEAKISEVAAAGGEPVEAVLREVADFRLALETDLLIAAAAMEVDAEQVAADVVDSERVELASFHERLLERLATAAAEDEIAVARARRARSSAWATISRSLSVAAAVLTVVAGAALVRSGRTPDRVVTSQPASMTTAIEQLDALRRVSYDDAPRATVLAAQRTLHETLQSLIALSDDPKVAEQIATMLRQERDILVTQRPDGMSVALESTSRLARELIRNVGPTVRTTVAPALRALVPVITRATPMASPSPRPKTSASPKPSPKPRPTTASPSPSASASASSSASADDDGNKLPGQVPQP